MTNHTSMVERVKAALEKRGEEGALAGDYAADFDALARAAILALREPSEGMLDAGQNGVWDFSPDYAYTGKDPEGKIENSGEGTARNIFNAMIDAILTEDAGK